MWYNIEIYRAIVRQVVCNTFTARRISKPELSEKSSLNQTVFNTLTARRISKPELSEKSSFNQIVLHACVEKIPTCTADNSFMSCLDFGPGISVCILGAFGSAIAILCKHLVDL